MSTKDTWVPFTEVARLEEVSEGRASHTMVLPMGTDTERLYINAERMSALGRVAGAMRIHAEFKNNYEMPDHHDIDSIGGGIAVLRGFKKPNKPAGDFSFTDTLGEADYGNHGEANVTDRIFISGKITCSIHRETATENVTSHKKNQKGALDERIWAKELDSSLKRVVLDAAKHKYLTSDEENFLTSRYYMVGMDAIAATVLTSLTQDFTPDAKASFVASAAIYSAAMYGFKVAITKTPTNYTDEVKAPLSLFPFSMIDRYPYAAVRVATLGPVVTYK